MNSLVDFFLGFLIVIGFVMAMIAAIFVGSKAAALIFLVISSAANAHEAPTGWSYPTACCNDTDASKVIEERQGYRVVSTGELVLHQSHKLKNSPDGLLHLCTWKGRDDTAVICLFAPPKGF